MNNEAGFYKGLAEARLSEIMRQQKLLDQLFDMFCAKQPKTVMRGTGQPGDCTGEFWRAKYEAMKTRNAELERDLNARQQQLDGLAEELKRLRANLGNALLALPGPDGRPIPWHARGGDGDSVVVAFAKARNGCIHVAWDHTLADGELLRFVQARDIQRAVAHMQSETGEVVDI